MLKKPDDKDLLSDDDLSFDENAAELIRQKIDRVFSEEPDLKDEIREVESSTNLSKHQKYMKELTSSGQDLATIQTKWHEYYISLPEKEKHEVWQEFYDSKSYITPYKGHAESNEQVLAKHKSNVKTLKTPRKLRHRISNKVSAGGKLSAKHHLQSLLFGLGIGFLVVFIFLFGFFNEVFIAPFIQPSRANASTPIIINTNAIAPTPNPEVIIPKINVQIPVNYTESSTNESVIEGDLQDGVVHYPTTVLPGQVGNTAYFGHSSNNIFNSGKYKFAFVLLHTLVNGDTFYLDYNNKVFVYKVISKSIVDPSNVGVLQPIQGQVATATLITCDPPGTSLHRLIVVGQQISPDPASNTTASSSTASISSSLPGDGPTLLHRVLSGVIGKIIAIFLLLGLIYYGLKIWWRQQGRLF